MSSNSKFGKSVESLATIRTKFWYVDQWLAQYGHLFNLESRQQWRVIEGLSLAPLMPAYDQMEVAHNFEQRPKKQEVTRNATPNPNFRPQELTQ